MPRLIAFSETARFMDSEAPSGKSAEISTASLTVAFGSLAKSETISSAISTKRILAVAAGTIAVAWNDRDFVATPPVTGGEPPGWRWPPPMSLGG
jgi:hypothetical protein